MTAPSPKEALELLPCPFCGGEAERIDIPTVGSDPELGGDPNAGGSCIQCKQCTASTALHFDRKENLYSSWNTRVALSTLQPSGERREAVARDTWASIEQYLRDECGLDCYGFSEGDRANCINVIVNADFLASGLVQDEAAIRANEREKLLGVVTDKLKDETSERYAKGWNNALIAVCAAIRSARDGGAS